MSQTTADSLKQTCNAELRIFRKLERSEMLKEREAGEAFLRRAMWYEVSQPEYERTIVCDSGSEANTCPRESKNKTEVKTESFYEM